MSPKQISVILQASREAEVTKIMIYQNLVLKQSTVLSGLDSANHNEICEFRNFLAISFCRTEKMLNLSSEKVMGGLFI